jgi:hypothetical protein
MATPQTLARKGRKGYALRKVAGGIYTSSSEEKEQRPVQNEKGAPPVFYLMLHHLTDTATQHCSRPHSQAEEPYGSVASAAYGQGVTTK